MIYKSFPHESEYLGPYVYGDDDWTPRAERMEAQGQCPTESDIVSNRMLLAEFCQDHRSLVKNTFLEKPPSKQITYADPSQPNKMANPIDPRTNRISRHPNRNYHFAQIDLVVVPRAWAPSITDVESRRGDLVYFTQHFAAGL